MNKILKAETISNYISKHMSRGVSFLDALLEFCNETGNDIEVVANIVKKNESLLQRAKEDAISLNLLSETREDNSLDEFFK